MSAIRAARSADVNAVHALVERAYRGNAARAGWTHEADLLEGARTSRAAIAALLDDPAETLLIAEASEVIVGCVQLTDRGAGLFYLGLLTVDPLRQAAGLGRTMLSTTEAHARRKGAHTVEMTVIDRRPELIAWYARRGYTLTGERRPFALPAPMPLDFVVLAKRLA